MFNAVWIHMTVHSINGLFDEFSNDYNGYLKGMSLSIHVHGQFKRRFNFPV